MLLTWKCISSKMSLLKAKKLTLNRLLKRQTLRCCLNELKTNIKKQVFNTSKKKKLNENITFRSFVCRYFLGYESLVNDVHHFATKI